MTRGPLWWLTKDGDRNCLAFYERHYSAYQYKDGRRRSQFVGPGETIVLRTDEYDAMFVWRKFIDDCVFWHTIYERWYEQDGVNCAVFRNEGPELSSELVRQADTIADVAWLGERHYTYVNAEKVRSKKPWILFHKSRVAKVRQNERRLADIGEGYDQHRTRRPIGLV